MTSSGQSHLISIPGASIAHLSNGEASPLFEGTVSLFVVNVPLDAPPSYASTSDSKVPPLPPRSRSVSPAAMDGNDQYLVLTISQGSEALLELPIPSSARLMTMPPRSYILPSAFGTNEEAGLFKLTLPGELDSETQEHFESILWGLTSFTTGQDSASQNGDAGDPTLRNKLVLVDEDSGRVVGTLADSKISADESLGDKDQGTHEKEPVVVQSSGVDGLVTVQPVSKYKPLDNPTNSRTVDFANFVSKGIIIGAGTIAKGMEAGADKFVQSSKPVETPLIFSSRTKSGVDRVSQYSSSALKVSGKTVAAIGSVASSVGDRLGKSLGIQSTPDGKPPKGIRGSLNRGLVAFNSVFDAAEEGGKTLLTSGSTSASKAVGHRYGQEAGDIAYSVGSSVKRCALVYVDVRGVSRKAVLKAAGKSALRAKMDDGREVILTDDKTAAQTSVEVKQ